MTAADATPTVENHATTTQVSPLLRQKKNLALISKDRSTSKLANETFLGPHHHSPSKYVDYYYHDLRPKLGCVYHSGKKGSSDNNYIRSLQDLDIANSSSIESESINANIIDKLRVKLQARSPVTQSH